MSSRSLAAAKAKRVGDNAPPPVSGNRPITSIGSQAAFAGYNMPPQPSNVRTARAMQPPPQAPKQAPKKYQQFYEQPQSQQQQYPQPHQPSQNSMPFSKLSISDAIGLITLRLGRVEQWVLDTEHEEEGVTKSDVPSNHTIIDNSVLATIINRLDSLEKNGVDSTSSEWANDLKTLTDQFKRMADDVSKHTIELSKNTEQVFRFNRELTETKDILKSFMVKYDMFASETSQNFIDYETALSDLEKRISDDDLVDGTAIDASVSDSIVGDVDSDNIILSVDLKNLIKNELGNI